MALQPILLNSKDPWIVCDSLWSGPSPKTKWRNIPPSTGDIPPKKNINIYYGHLYAFYMSIHVFLSTHVGRKTWTKTLLTPNRNSTFTLNIYCSPPPMTATTHTGRISVWPANGRAAATTRWLSWEQQKSPTSRCLWRKFVWVFFWYQLAEKNQLGRINLYIDNL